MDHHLIGWLEIKDPHKGDLVNKDEGFVSLDNRYLGVGLPHRRWVSVVVEEREVGFTDPAGSINMMAMESLDIHPAELDGVVVERTTYQDKKKDRRNFLSTRHILITKENVSYLNSFRH